MNSITRARDNPFAVQHVSQVRYRLLQGSWDDLLSRLQELNSRAAIVGPEGRGKTTLLEDLAERLSRQGRDTRWLRLNQQRPSLPSRQWRHFFDGLKPTDIIFVDGAEQLGRWAWRRLRRRTQSCAGLVITSHNPGLLPTLIDCQTTLPLLTEIVSQLVPSPSDQLQQTTRRLFNKHNGNLRDTLRELYDLHAGQVNKSSRQNQRFSTRQI